MTINNHHPDNIIITIDNITYQLLAHSSIQVPITDSSICCKIIHNISFRDDSLCDKVINAVSKITAIIVDSEYVISEIKEDTVVDITNEIIAYEKDDVCIIYHGVFVKNAKVQLRDCDSPNAKKFIAARKVLLLSDANDFPIISPIIALIRYKKIKKLVSQQKLWDIVSNKTN